VKPDWPRLFRAPVTHEEIVFRGGTESVPWPDGPIETVGGQKVGQVTKGVPDFIGVEWHSKLEAEKMDGWVEDGWAAAKERVGDPLVRILVDALLSVGPARVDIGTGPAGRFMAYLLAHDPSASVMGSDIEVRTISAWARFLRDRSIAPNAFLACFDACKIPFADGCLDAVSSCAGLTNVPFQNLAIGETTRVLRDGGLLVVMEEQACDSSFPIIQEVFGPQLVEAVPGFIGGWANLIESFGFVVEQHTVGSRRQLHPNESGLATKAASKGYRIEVEEHYIVARK
jgi:SAM-dependent methyltransferase